MRLPLCLLAAVVGLTACGDPTSLGRQPGFDSGEVLFWRIDEVASSRQACGDAPELDSVVIAPGVAPGSHLVLEVSDDATSARWLRCSTRELATCQRDPVDPLFTVEARDTIHFERVTRTPIENGEGCVLQINEQWTLVDRGIYLEGAIVRTHTLTDSELGCGIVDLDLLASSTNGLGLDGCVLTTAVHANID